jgi:light-regulated signal transduction histidine kinase (bacteriophytochrome)
LETGEPYRLELELVHPDGATRWVLAVGGAASDDGGGGVRLCSTVQDITETKLAEAEIQRLNTGLEQRVAARTAELEAVNKELEAFVYSAAHDLRAPLRAIDGFSQMVVEDATERLDDADREHLQRVRAAAERMGALIDHLIELSRTARVDLVSERVDLSAVAAEVLTDLRRLAPERRVEAVVQPGLVVEADATLIEVILVNLLGNAWKFTSQRETAHIDVGATDGDGERAFFVRDDGAGFDLDNAEHLFGAFQRFHTPEEFPGDGIGLATVKRLVTRHGGRVWAEAEVGEGATFFFTLPAVLPAD